MKMLFLTLILFQATAFAEAIHRKRHPGVPFHSGKALYSKKPGFVDTVYTFLGGGEESNETTEKVEIKDTQKNLAKVVDPSAEIRIQMDLNAGQRENISEGDSADCNKNMSCFAISNGENSLENLQNDLAVCDCLDERFNISAPPSMSKKNLQEEMKKREMKINEGKLLASLQEFKKNIVIKRDSLLLEAHLVSDEQVVKVLNTTQTKETSDLYRDVLNSFKGKVSDQVFQDASAMIDGFSDEFDRSETVLENLNRATKRPESCFPFSEYLRASMIPGEPEFWKDLLDNKELKKSDDWNYFSLLSKYERGEDRVATKAKLDFLNRNPTLKTLFNSPNHVVTNEAYKLLRSTLKPTSSCVKEGNCRGAFFKNGGNLQKSLKDLYIDPNIQSYNAGFNHVDTIILIGGISNSIFEEPSIPSLRFAFSSENVRYDHCDVNADFNKAPGCAELFQNYCSELKENKATLIKALNTKAGNIYRDDWIKDLEAEPSKNQGYLKQQDLMCNKMARTYPFSSEVLNFRGFKEKHCAKIDCSPFDDTQLFKMFIKETRATDKVFDEEGQLVRGGQDAQLLAQASADNVTAVREIDMGVLATVVKSNQLSNMSKAKNISISDFFEEGNSNQTMSKVNADLDFPADATTPTDSTVNESTFIDPNISANSFQHQFGTGQLVDNLSHDSAISDARNELDELKKEEVEIQSEIREVKKEMVSNASNGANDEALEMRLENLEKLLAEKEKSSQNYQELISKLIETNTKLKNQSSSPTDAEDEEPSINEATRVKATNRVAVIKPAITNEEVHSPQRAPASIENFSTSSSSMGGGAAVSTSSFSTAAKASGRLNGALLAKYGIMVQEAAQGSSISVAPEAESSRFAVMGPFRDAASLPLEVSKTAFDQFRVNDLSALQDLYKNSLENMDNNVIKILVSLEDSTETLEFYAIKEEGKVVFQPIRKNKLSDLQNALSTY